jgi:uncharacterized cupredoxin-like copper-binding protein
MKHIRMIVLLGISVFLLAACGASGATPDASGELSLIQVDDEGGMHFSPGDIVLTAGQKVRIVLENQGEKNHELMIGKNVIRMANGAPDGFEIDFFEGIEDLVQVQLGMGSMLMIDGETVMGMDMGEEDGGMDMGGEGEMDHMGWMLMSPAGSGKTIIEFTVPADKVGEWEMGCFEDEGTHYDDGMRGTLTVVAP